MEHHIHIGWPFLLVIALFIISMFALLIYALFRPRKEVITRTEVVYRDRPFEGPYPAEKPRWPYSRPPSSAPSYTPPSYSPYVPTPVYNPNDGLLTGVLLGEALAGERDRTVVEREYVPEPTPAPEPDRSYDSGSSNDSGFSYDSGPSSSDSGGGGGGGGGGLDISWGGDS